MIVIFFFSELMISLGALIAVAVADRCYKNGKEAIGTVIEVEDRRNSYDLVLVLRARRQYFSGVEYPTK